MTAVGDPVAYAVHAAVGDCAGDCALDGGAPVHDGLWSVLTGPNRSEVWEDVGLPVWWPVHFATGSASESLLFGEVRE